MATTSARLLTLLSLLGARSRWRATDLADRLLVSTRTLRRDIDALRELGYPVQADKGPDGGYRLAAGGRLPPLLLDDEQAVAVAIALQTAPLGVAGIGDAGPRALASIASLMPAPLRAEIEALHLTAIRSAWEFPGPPIPAATLRAVGSAVRNGHQLRVDHLTPDGHRPDPADPDFAPPQRLDPHHLVSWAGRWYLVSYLPGEERWGIYRVDRLHAHAATGIAFTRRDVPGGDVARYVMTSHERGDTPARWQCLGSAVMALPPDIVARWAPGGSVVEHTDPGKTRLTVGAWSWAGIAGLLATFDADLDDVQPEELKAACATLARRYQRASGRP